MRYLFPDGSEAGAQMAAEMDAMASIPQHLWTEAQRQLIASTQQDVDQRMKAQREARNG